MQAPRVKQPWPGCGSRRSGRAGCGLQRAAAPRARRGRDRAEPMSRQAGDGSACAWACVGTGQPWPPLAHGPRAAGPCLHTEPPHTQAQSAEPAHTRPVPCATFRVPHTRVPPSCVPPSRVPHTRVAHTRVPHTRVPRTRVPHTRVPPPVCHTPPRRCRGPYACAAPRLSSPGSVPTDCACPTALARSQRLDTPRRQAGPPR